MHVPTTAQVKEYLESIFLREEEFEAWKHAFTQQVEAEALRQAAKELPLSKEAKTALNTRAEAILEELGR